MENQHIDILLDADQMHVHPIQVCRSGSVEMPSLVYYYQAGVILLGSASCLKKNLAYLNQVESFIEKFNTTF